MAAGIILPPVRNGSKQKGHKHTNNATTSYYTINAHALYRLCICTTRFSALPAFKSHLTFFVPNHHSLNMGKSFSRPRGDSSSCQGPINSPPCDIPAKPLAKMPTVRKNEPVPSYTNIAAIDFGTTYCSLAFKTAGDSGATVMRLDGTDRRVPNAMLLQVTETESVCTMCKLSECEDQRKCAADFKEQERQTPRGKESVAIPKRIPKHFKYKVNSFGHLAQRNYQLLRRNKYESHIYFERVKLAAMQKEVQNYAKTVLDQ